MMNQVTILGFLSKHNFNAPNKKNPVNPACLGVHPVKICLLKKKRGVSDIGKLYLIFSFWIHILFIQLVLLCTIHQN